MSNSFPNQSLQGCTNNWGLQASYAWSKSYGLIPSMLTQYQLEPVCLRIEGNDPNHFINAEGRLQADRPHMFRVQAVFLKLPGDIKASASMDISSGRHHTRQIRVFGLGQGSTAVIMERGLRHSPTEIIDLTVGKTIQTGKDLQLRVEGTVYNLLNSDQELYYASLELQDPSQTFLPIQWVKPRRLQIQLGLQF